MLSVDPQPSPRYSKSLGIIAKLLGGLGSPTVFTFLPDISAPLTYVDRFGRAWTVDDQFEFDGATTPRLFWSIPGFSPWDSWYRAAAVHDWLWSEHHAGRDKATFDESNELLFEMILACGVSKWKARFITWAIRKVGRSQWDKNQKAS